MTDGFSDGAPAGPGGAMPAPGRMLGGRYRLGGVIGTGGSGTVYLADDLSLGRQVAVKVLHSSLVGDEAFVERFRSEARLVLHSPTRTWWPSTTGGSTVRPTW